jgi:hypothetical protein
MRHLISMKKNRFKRPVKAGSVLGKVLGQMGLVSSISKHKVVQLWPEIVDVAISRHAKAIKVEGSTLCVIVDSSVWMNELAAVKSLLLQKVNSHIKSESARITDIRFHQRSWAREDPKEPDSPAVPAAELSEKDIRLIRTILEPVKDEQLRSVLRRLLEKDALLKQTKG